MSAPRHAWLRCAALLMLTSAAVQAQDIAGRSGKDLYRQYCAACHGESGRGDGPVSGSFRVEVPDLTLLARRHGGRFPRDLVERIIDGRYIIGAHGTRVMPVWGEEFGRTQLGDPNAEIGVRTAIVRLADYVWQLQRPAPQEP